MDGFALYQVVFSKDNRPADFIFVDVNPAWERMMGISRQDVIGKRTSAVFPEDDYPRWFALCEKTVLTGQPNVTLSYSPKADDFFKVLMFCPSRDTLAMVCDDVTGKLVTERQVLRQLKMERAIAQVSSILIAGEDVDIVGALGILGQAVNAGRAVIVLYGTLLDEIVDVFEWCAPGTASVIPGIRERFERYGKWWTDTLNSRDTIAVRDTSSLPREMGEAEAVTNLRNIRSIFAVPIRSRGELIGCIALHDTTSSRDWSDGEEYVLQTASGCFATYFERRSMVEELRKTEEELDASRQLFESFVDNSQAMAFMKDEQGRYIYVNSNYRKSFSCMSEDFLSRSDYDLWPAGVAEIIRRRDAEALTSGKPSETLETVPFYGEIRKWHVFRFPLEDAQGNPLLGVTAYDETDRERVQAELKERELAYKTLANSLPQTVFEANADGLLTFVNEGAYEMFGYTHEDFESGVNCLQTIALHDRERAKTDIARVLQAEITDGAEYTALRKDGSTFPIAIYASPVRKNGVAVGLRGMIVDITLRKAAEEQTETQRAQLLSIFDSINELIHVTDVETHEILFANKAFHETFGEVLPGDKCYEKLCRTSEPCDFCKDRASTNDEGDSRQWEYHNSVTDRDYIITNRLIEWPDGRTVQFSFSLDVTDHKRAEMELMASEQRFRAVFDGTEDGLIIADSGGRCVDANPAACSLFGMTREELNGHSLLESAHDGAHSQGSLMHYTIEKDGQGEARVVKPDGSTRLIEYQSTEDILPGQNLVVIRDVTEQRLYQEHINQSHKMQTIGQLAAGIAHDFNNLLQGILGYSFVLQGNATLDTTALDDLNQIERAARRAADLVQQILAFSRQVPAKAEPLDVRALSLEAAKLIWKTFPRTITIKRRGSSNPAVALADGSQIHQVIMNLCVNARDAMPNGGELTLSVDKVTLSPDFVKSNPWAREGDFVRCTVSDTGCGMDKETIDRAFEPFFTTKVGEGSGLGLSTCYGIIMAHNGLIHLKSSLGHGTAVIFYLPYIGDAVPGLPPSPEAISVRGSETILLVDDEDYIRKFSGRVLESNGYRVVSADNGRSALEQFHARPEEFDLIILDLNMPDMDGITALSAMRKLAPESKVLVSAGLDTGLDDLLPEERPSAFLQKPYNPQDLLETIRRILDEG